MRNLRQIEMTNPCVAMASLVQEEMQDAKIVQFINSTDLVLFISILV